MRGAVALSSTPVSRTAKTVIMAEMVARFSLLNRIRMVLLVREFDCFCRRCEVAGTEIELNVDKFPGRHPMTLP